jgi:hypothetical protein
MLKDDFLKIFSSDIFQKAKKESITHLYSKTINHMGIKYYIIEGIEI